MAGSIDKKICDNYNLEYSGVIYSPFLCHINREGSGKSGITEDKPINGLSPGRAAEAKSAKAESPVVYTLRLAAAY